MFKCKICGCSDSKKFYPKNKSNCKDCISEKMKTKYTIMSEEDKIIYKKKQTIWQEKNMLRYRLLVAKDRSKKKKIEFNISEDFLYKLWENQNGLCYYSNIELSLKVKDLHSVSIDRKNSKIGYVEDNVVLCSSIINSMKNNLEIEEFKKIIEILYNSLNNSAQPTE